MKNIEATQFDIGGWRVDPMSNCIGRDGETVKIEPRAMSVLVHLARNPGVVATREELESNVWAGRVVGYDALSNTIIKLRKAFKDNARNPQVIETISKTGYRLISTVTFDEDCDQFEVRDKIPDPSNVLEHKEHKIPDIPSIAVLAFENMSDDSRQEYFSDGLSEDIITDLSKIPGLFVIARNSSFSYKGKITDVKSISKELGVRYILEGSVRKSGDDLRITAQLIDGISGGHIWADRYDRKITDIFALQDAVTRDILNSIAPKLVSYQASNSDSRFTENIEAYDYFLRGRERSFQDTEKANSQARKLLEKAIALDPGFSSAYSHLGRNHTLSFINRWGSKEEQSLERAFELGRKAIDLNTFDPHAHFSTSATLLWMKTHDLAREEAQKSISLEPNFAEGYAILGGIQMYSGKASEGILSLEKAMRLDPHYRSIYLHLIAQAHFHNLDYKNAIQTLKSRLIRKPDSDISRALLASCFGHVGEFGLSRSEWRELLKISPNYSLTHRLEILPYKNKRDIDHFVEGLRKAGLA